MPPDGNFKYSKIPGALVHWVGHPTAVDPHGCDGLYISAIYVVNETQFQLYCNVIAKPWYRFSVN